MQDEGGQDPQIDAKTGQSLAVHWTQHDTGFPFRWRANSLNCLGILLVPEDAFILALELLTRETGTSE